MLKAKAK